MRYAIVADIHANLAAFAAVIEDIVNRDVGEVWCLGDIVGYGPDPHECLELLQRCNHVCVAGNHDWGSVGKTSLAEFNRDAAIACRWTAQQLTPEDKTYLESLPQTINKGDFTLVHGSPRQPIWEYVLSTGVAAENFPFFESKYCLVGHSHIPLVFKLDEKGCTSSKFSANISVALGKDRLIINPGGVGQPRDNDPRASYAVYDTESRQVKNFRIAYDIAATQAKMMKYGLPMRLVARLDHGV